jgi:hypothetical protein
MSDLVEVPIAHWSTACSPDRQHVAMTALERGQVLLFPQLDFVTSAEERRAMTASVSASNKNVSFDPATGLLRGSTGTPSDQQLLADMLRRYGQATLSLVDALFPDYTAGRRQGRTSLRPVEIEGRQTSWRKDDTRLHVDSFPATPTQGRRILRVFTNLNPNGEGRHWRLGEPFDAVARRLLPRLAPPLPGLAALMEMLGITKTRRTAYDHYMLRLHDSMKANPQYQARAPQTAHEFPPHCSWMVYTDQVSHAATRGLFALEQTWMLDVAAMRDPDLSPLHVLQRVLGRALA